MAYIDTEKLKRNIRVNLMPNVDIDGTVTVENAERYFLNLIDKTSTADVVEVVRCKDCKHGEWEKFEIPHMMRCSECGVSDLDIHRTKFDFCPYCGAKMDGKDNNVPANGRSEEDE